jgi:DNA-binding LacI/PurR family transcriptional regulator
MMVTAKDVAALAGVAQSTVSYVMSGKRSISPETRAKVEAAIRQLTFQPNAGAQALASRRSNVIGLVVRFSRTTDMAGVLPFIETITFEARSRGYDVVLVTDDDGTESMQRLAGRSLVDAIVLMDIRAHDDRLAVAAELPIPVVLIGVAENTHGLDAIDFDFERAGGLAAEELVQTGHRRIIVLGEPPEVLGQDFSFISGFEHGALDAGKRAGARTEVLRPTEVGWAGIRDLAPELLRDTSEGLGIIARTPQAIGWVLQLLLIEGLRPGEDVAVVGLCTDTVAESFSVPVTNVSPEPAEVSRVAMAHLFDQLAGSRPGAVSLVPPRLTHRSTTPEAGVRSPSS